jgi:hypothetical protein
LLEQSEPALHEVPVEHFVGQLPPQSVPVSLPFLMPSVQLAARQIPLGQLAVVQSAPVAHFSPTGHLEQLPPQSTSVSLPFFAPSPHAAL